MVVPSTDVAAEKKTHENEVIKKLNQIQSSVDSLKNSGTSIKG